MSGRPAGWRRFLRLWRPNTEADIDAELRFHFEQKVAGLVARGAAPEVARAQAVAEFGDVDAVRSSLREIDGRIAQHRRRAEWWESIAQDLGYVVRTLRRSPGFTLAVVFTLALGIGANTAMFSIVDALVLRALPVRHAGRLAIVPSSLSNPVWEGIRDRRQLFDGGFAWSDERFNLAEGGEVDPVDGLWVSGRVFDVLGVDAVAGRLLSESDDRRGGGPDGPVAVISSDFWQRRFGGAADVVGRTISLSGVTYTIVGVTSAGFFGPAVGRTFDVAVPLGTEPLVRGREDLLDDRSSAWLNVMVRLKPGQSAEQATTTLRAVQPRIADETRPTDWPPQQAATYLITPLVLKPGTTGSSALRSSYQRPLFTIMTVVVLVLLIACGNIANLFLARATARRHELSVRIALGVSRWRLARQLLAESLLLSSIGAAFGVVVALVGSRLIVRQLSTSVNRVFLDVGLDWRMLCFTAAVAIGTALLFGIVPAFRATRVAPIEAMKEQGRSTSSGRLFGLGSTLVMGQVALSLVLVVAAGLFVRTFASLAERNLGFERGHVLLVNIGAKQTGLDSAARGAMYERIREAALAVPQVTQAAVSRFAPVTRTVTTRAITLPGRPELSERERIAFVHLVSPGWFSTLGTPLLIGRDFDDRDHLGAKRAVIVNETFARKYFGRESPIGQVILEGGGPTSDRNPLEIIGVVGDAIYRSLRDAIPPTFYLSLSQVNPPPSTVVLIVRTASGSPALVSKSIGVAVTGVDRNLSLQFRSLADQVDASLTQERLTAMLSGFFGALALLLSAVGLYGVTSYSVNRRKVELGIRIALGTSPSGVVRLVLARVGLLVGGGVLVGAIASWWAVKFVGTLLYGLAPHDPSTIVGAIVVLAAAGAVAGWLPARRAARIDPARVLREG